MKRKNVYSYYGLKKDDYAEYCIQENNGKTTGTIEFTFTCASSDMAEKIAYDKFVEFQSIYQETGSCIDAVKAIGAISDMEAAKKL